MSAAAPQGEKLTDERGDRQETRYSDQQGEHQQQQAHQPPLVCPALPRRLVIAPWGKRSLEPARTVRLRPDWTFRGASWRPAGEVGQRVAHLPDDALIQHCAPVRR